MFDPSVPFNDLPLLSNLSHRDYVKFLPHAIQATQSIAKLDGLSMLLPNYEVLIHPLLAQESIASNEIENIHTTMTKFLQQEALWVETLTWPEKEVAKYCSAILYWVEQLEILWGITTNLLIELQAIIEPDKTWIRKIPWTVIASWSWTILYTPPVWKDVITNLLSDLEQYINADHWIDPLLSVWIIHHQFESIHPFYDGNWRVWRILMILYLILKKKISKPILFLSSYIIDHKTNYYTSFVRLEQSNNFDTMVHYILQWITRQSQHTQEKVLQISSLIEQTSYRLKAHSFKEHHDITIALFTHPYISINTLAEALDLTRQSVSTLVKKLHSLWIIDITNVKNRRLVSLPEFIALLS